MSGVVGSIPSFTRSGRPAFSAAASFSARAPFGRLSTASRANRAAASEGSGSIRPNARLPRSAEPVAVRPFGRRKPGRRAFVGALKSRTSVRVSDPDNIVYLRDHAAALDPPAGVQGGDFAGGEKPPKPKLKKIRLGVILIGLAALAGVSTVFGMMMAVASDLPSIENRSIYHGAQNSKIYDVNGRQIGLITGKQNQVLVGYNSISPTMRNAIISIEDRRFYDNRGI